MNLGSLISESEFATEPAGFFFARICRVARYQKGFIIAGGKKPTIESHYSELPAFSHQKVSHYINGFPQGLIYHFSFAWPTMQSKVVRFTFVVPREGSPWNGTARNPNSHPDLEMLGRELTSAIGSRLLREFTQTGSVAWTHDTSFERSGITFFNKKGSTLLSYHAIDQYEMFDDQLCIGSSREGITFRIPRAALNFSPGLIVLQELLHSLK